MLLSLRWLQEFTPYAGTAEDLGNKLTMRGLELEEIKKPAEKITHIVIGHVITCEKHPEADKLSVCTVDVAGAEVLSIVCGAPNVRAGLKVPVATIGTTMPDGMQIKKAKLRGVESCGMICSERELGLSDDHDGIMELDADAPVGKALVDFLGINDQILDISVTPNRADCLSVLGLAREIAQTYTLPLTMPKMEFTGTQSATDAQVTLVLPHPELCPLYTGQALLGAQNGKSPAWLRYRLLFAGIRPISRLVDITNYVMLELGQPLHAFDLDTIEGSTIQVIPAEEGQELVTLDNANRTLKKGDILIADAKKALGLAGVMGGANSEITASTKNVFLESAVFHAPTIRKTARRLGLQSEASYRFERGVDQNITRVALARASNLMAELTQATVNAQYFENEPKPFVAVAITFQPERARSVLGFSEAELSNDFCKETLTTLGCSISEQANAWEVTPSSARLDLTREADLFEEVGRVRGLDTVKPTLPRIPHFMEKAGEPESEWKFWMRLRRWGSGLGLNEVINYSFVGHKDLDVFTIPQEKRITVMNPLSEDQNVLRTDLIPGLVRNLRHNTAQGNHGVRLFELAHVFSQDAQSETTAQENGRLGFLVWGNRSDTAWPNQQADQQADHDYHDILGIIQHLCTYLHLGTITVTKKDDCAFLAPALTVRVQGKNTGLVGLLNADIADSCHTSKEVWYAELCLDRILHMVQHAKIQFSLLAQFPPIRRDITVIAPLAMHSGTIVGQMHNITTSLLEHVEIVDIFYPKNPKDPENPHDTAKRNITYRLTFRHKERTLKDAEVDSIREKISKHLIDTLAVSI